MSQFLYKTIGRSLNLISIFAPHFASTKALKLFSTPRKGKLTDAEIPALQSAFYEELDYNNLVVATYRWIGKNKTILLVHGWESNASRWHYLIKLLKAQNYNIIALDAPAHGQSGSKEFNAILYSEFICIVVKKFNPEIIIGHSVGAMAAIFGLHKYTISSVSKIISLGAPGHFEGAFNRYVEMMGYNKRISRGMHDLILERFGQRPEYFSAAKFSETISSKGLIIHDQFDDIIPYEEAVHLHKCYKNSELITTTNLGHSLRDDSVSEKILNFINS